MKEKIKVLFLDIDGVLNSELWFRKRPQNTEVPSDIDDEAFKLIVDFIKKNDLKLVISSTWRLGKEGTGNIEWDDFVRRLRENDITIFGKTPWIMTRKYSRGLEINEWLKSCKTEYDVEAFAIVDDEYREITRFGFGKLKKHFVKTHQYDGLTEKHIDLLQHIVDGGKVTFKVLEKVNRSMPGSIVKVEQKKK